MSSVERKELNLRRDDLLVKAYLWAWEADPNKIDFCKLFWGTIFFPLAVIIHWGEFIIGKIDKYVIQPVRKRNNERRRLRESQITAEMRAAEQAEKDRKSRERWEKQAKLEEERRRKKAQRLARYEAKANVWRNRWDTIWKWIKWPLAALGVALSVALIGGLVWVIVEHFVKFIIGVGIAIGSVAVLLGLILLAVYIDDRKGSQIKRSFKAMKEGAKGFKHRTCPLVTIEDDGTADAT